MKPLQFSNADNVDSSYKGTISYLKEDAKNESNQRHSLKDLGRSSTKL